MEQINRTENAKDIKVSAKTKEIIKALAALEDSMETLKKEVEIEKNAKNTAYYFILSNGLFEAFEEFHKTNRSENPKQGCIKSLLKQCSKL